MTEVTEEQTLLADAALTSFRLNGQLLAVAEELARPVGLTAAWWQVLGGALRDPQTVSDIARAMGLTRQSVQRTADLLVDNGLATYAENPAHRRAKLFLATEDGVRAVRAINPAHRVTAQRLADEIGVAGWPRCSPGCTSCPRPWTASSGRRPSRRRAASTTAS